MAELLESTQEKCNFFGSIVEKLFECVFEIPDGMQHYFLGNLI
jgi:hypothetical protein